MSRTAAHRAPGLDSLDALVLPVIEELTASLRLAGITDPRRVASDIIAALLDVPRSWPIMNRDSTLAPAIVHSARKAARMLSVGAPFAYAVGSAQFRNLSLQVDERVLIPRPETEVLVGEILDRMQRRHPDSGTWGTAIDIGTGSGAIALSLATEGNFERVIATDTSLDALDVAPANALRVCHADHSLIEFRRGSLIAPVSDVTATLLVSNPPYVAFSEIDLLPSGVRDWEPPLALLSAANGMAATAAIVQGGTTVLASGGLLALEVDERRASLVAELIMSNNCYAGVGVGLDLSGRARFVFASRI